jgi:hypothetical protein
MAGLYGQGNGGVGVEGHSDTNSGVFGYSNSGLGLMGISVNTTAIFGHSDPGIGIHGDSKTNTGVFGHSESGWGVQGVSGSNTGVLGTSDTGRAVHGISNHFSGVEGWGQYGVLGLGVPNAQPNQANIGVIGIGRGTSGIGVVGQTDPAHGFAGFFDGRVQVTGYVSKAGGGFRIDHPRDPANKYLNHSFVESSKMTNLYDGIATLDEDGTAWVELPEWFEALNGEFRYQLTAVGGSAPNLHVAEEIHENHRFKIAGGKGGKKVCWQVTGSRKDAWAAANPIEVEQEKPPQDRGRYLHPHLYNAPEEQRVRIGSMEDERRRQMTRQGPPRPPEMPPGFKPPQAPEMPPRFVFDMQVEHRRQIEGLRQQIEELRRSRLEEEHRRQIDELRRQIEELRRRP